LNGLRNGRSTAKTSKPEIRGMCRLFQVRSAKLS